MHPLTPNLTTLTLEELNTKYSELTKRMLQAQRMGNGSLIHQIGMVLEDYRNEINARQRKIIDDATKTGNFKNIIDIN